MRPCGYRTCGRQKATGFPETVCSYFLPGIVAFRQHLQNLARTKGILELNKVQLLYEQMGPEVDADAASAGPQLRDLASSCPQVSAAGPPGGPDGSPEPVPDTGRFIRRICPCPAPHSLSGSFRGAAAGQGDCPRWAQAAGATRGPGTGEPRAVTGRSLEECALSLCSPSPVHTHSRRKTPSTQGRRLSPPLPMCCHLKHYTWAMYAEDTGKMLFIRQTVLGGYF